MNVPIEITLSETIYQRAAHLAQRQQRNIPDVLTTFLEQHLPDVGEPPITKTIEVDEEVEREREAYLHLHPTLWAQVPNEYVALRRGKLVDHDRDKNALLMRINEQFPDEFVLMRQVQSDPDPEYHFVSVRLDI